MAMRPSSVKVYRKDSTIRTLAKLANGKTRYWVSAAGYFMTE
jgi:hypothetical protein